VQLIFRLCSLQGDLPTVLKQYNENFSKLNSLPHWELMDFRYFV